ncbi:MAG: FHA domain-containing protein [Lachnospiraceae bacterium]|nr:FHA domain-containing protein [Lachnospiraceae bacterium]
MVLKCKNGHWYDTTVHKTCPHCKRDSEKLSIRIDDDIEEDDRTISIAEVDISLGEELGAIIGESINNMVGGVSGDASLDDDKTISFGFFGIMETQSVTGWLVCMTGSEKGKDFRLHSGKNFVGRSTSMDVILIDDKTISRDKHCSVVYDPKGNNYYASAENGNIMYVNGRLTDSPTAIQEGDIISIGETKLLFIPFCKEGRSWENE